MINRLTVSFEVDHTSFRIAWGSIIDSTLSLQQKKLMLDENEILMSY